MEIANHLDNLELALNEVEIYERLEDVQGECIPELIFHIYAWPFYLIGLSFIEGEKLVPSDSDARDKLERIILPKLEERLVTYHNPFPDQIIVNKQGNPWLLDFARSYIKRNN